MYDLPDALSLLRASVVELVGLHCLAEHPVVTLAQAVKECMRMIFNVTELLDVDIEHMI